MKENIKKFHKQNNGSTLIIVLTVIAFLSILAVVVTSSALVNYKMKIINKQAQKAFYTAEDAVDEIYAALGKLSMECFDGAYNEELSTVIKQTSVGGTDVAYTLSGLTTNSNLRKNFTYRLVTGLEILNNPSADKYNKDSFVKTYNSEEELGKFVAALNSYLEDTDGRLQVLSVEALQVNEKISEADSSLRIYELTFTNCAVRYLNEEQYYSNIAFDGNIAMPDIYIEFATDMDRELKTFTQYALVGNTGVSVDEDRELTLDGNIYAGKLKGLQLGKSSTLTSNNVTVISGGDIKVVSASLNATAAQVWCTSLITEGDESSNVTITGGSTFVKDDLQVNSNDSRVTIGGNYYGYSYQGFNESEGNHNNSSAVIVNGYGSVLDLSRISSLIIGGRAYIDYNTGDTDYVTGESLSFKGSQEMYLVPSYLMNKSNPVVGDTSGVTVDISDGNFFGYEYLDTVIPFTKRTVTEGTEQVTYYYLKFKNDQSASAYVKALFDDDTYNGVIQGKPENIVSAWDKSRAYVKSLVNANLNSLSSSVLTASSDAKVYTNGQMINAIISEGKVSAALGAADNEYETPEYSGTTDGFALDARDLSNRYSLMTRILISPSFYNDDGTRNYYIDEIGNKVIIDGKYVDVSGYGENNIFANFVSMEAFKSLTEEKAYFNTDGSSIIAAINNSMAIEVSNEEASYFKDYNSGIIVASGDVIVKKSFSGTILAGGEIKIEGDNIQVSNTISGTSVEELIDGDRDFQKIFNAYNPQASEEEDLSLSEMTYKDFVEFINWRKSL